MQEVASDNGMGPVTGQATPATGGDVGGLVAAVESKMAELMAWHAQQTKQLETDKTVLEAQADKQRQSVEAAQQQLAERLEQVEQQRVKLAGLANKLRAEEAAMSREWGEVQKERETVQKQAAEVAKLRERTEARAQAWLETTAADLSEPLKLTTDVDYDHDDEQHHEAA